MRQLHPQPSWIIWPLTPFGPKWPFPLNQGQGVVPPTRPADTITSWLSPSMSLGASTLLVSPWPSCPFSFRPVGQEQGRYSGRRDRGRPEGSHRRVGVSQSAPQTPAAEAGDLKPGRCSDTAFQGRRVELGGQVRCAEPSLESFAGSRHTTSPALTLFSGAGLGPHPGISSALSSREMVQSRFSQDVTRRADPSSWKLPQLSLLPFLPDANPLIRSTLRYFKTVTPASWGPDSRSALGVYHRPCASLQPYLLPVSLHRTLSHVNPSDGPRPEHRALNTGSPWTRSPLHLWAVLAWNRGRKAPGG